MWSERREASRVPGLRDRKNGVLFTDIGKTLGPGLG
jgi:hypothetical protein